MSQGTGTGGRNGYATALADQWVALSRTLAFSGEYFFYRYQFDQGVALPAGLAPRLTRHGVRFGLDLWLPVIH